jgi:hypothetical protein
MHMMDVDYKSDILNVTYMDILVAMIKLGSFCEEYGIGFHQNNGSSVALLNYQPVQPLKGYKNQTPGSFPSILVRRCSQQRVSNTV